MRNATSMESSAGATTDLQAARQGCIELEHQAESIAEGVLPLLRQATQELNRLETQRDELRKTTPREMPPAVMPKLLERIEEQAQSVKRLERANRALKELISSIGGLGAQVQSGLVRRDEEQREQEAITREEKRMWLQELNTLREQVAGHSQPSAPTTAQQEEMQRLRSENEVLPKLRAERDRLTHRVSELEKQLSTRDQTLAAKEQTIEDLRRMIVLLTGDKNGAPSAHPTPQPSAPPVAVTVVSLPPKPAAPKARPSEKPAPKATENMFGNSTMQLAHSMLETLGEESSTPIPLVESTLVAERKVSMEIMLGPLDELEALPRPLTPPPVPFPPPVPMLPPAVLPVVTKPSMPRASRRAEAPAPGPARTPAPVPSSAPAPAPPPAPVPVSVSSASAPPKPLPLDRPGTLVISEDMFNEMLVEENLGAPGKK